MDDAAAVQVQHACTAVRGASSELAAWRAERRPDVADKLDPCPLDFRESNAFPPASATAWQLTLCGVQSQVQAPSPGEHLRLLWVGHGAAEHVCGGGRACRRVGWARALLRWRRRGVGLARRCAALEEAANAVDMLQPRILLQVMPRIRLWVVLNTGGVGTLPTRKRPLAAVLCNHCRRHCADAHKLRRAGKADGVGGEGGASEGTRQSCHAARAAIAAVRC